jgi:limonene-1,2-epoxide hydrolase
VSTPQQVVEEFCALMVQRDADALRPYLARDAVYQNTGRSAVSGLEAVLENLAGQFERFPDSYEYRMLNIASDGGVVLTERQDMIRGPDGSLHAVPVMGAFVVEDGRIVRWTDYWDTTLPAKMLGGEDYRDLVPRY